MIAIAPVRVHQSRRTCKCAAYPFPHRAAGGACTDPGPDPGSCADCDHSLTVRDPYATGDSLYTTFDCAVDQCPWGRQ